MQLTILLQFLAIERHFVRKGCAGRVATRNFTLVFCDRTSFHAKGLRRTRCNSQFYIRFWRSNLISCERVASDALHATHNFTAVFGDRTSFRAKGLRRTRCNSQFYISFWRSNLISCERVAPDALQLAILLQFLAIERHFVRKGSARTREIAILHCISCRLVGIAPHLQERIQKKERARGQESKRAREQEGKM